MKAVKLFKLCKISAVALAMGFISSTSALALVAVETVGSDHNRRDDFSGNVGFQFTVGASDLSVTSLGFWDEGENGLVQSHIITLYDDVGTQLAQTTIQAGTLSTLSGPVGSAFRYEALGSAVTLTAGNTYRLAAGVTNGGGDVWTQSNNGGISPNLSSAHVYNSNLTVTTAVFTNPGTGNNTTAAFPNDTGVMGTNVGFIGPGMEFTVVPEPSTYALVLGGLGLLYGLRRIGNKQKA